MTGNQSVCLGGEHRCGTCDQILLAVDMLQSEICCLVSVGRPLWREDGSAICIAITQWSESHRTPNHTLLSHLRLPQPEGWGWGYVTTYGQSVSQYVLVSSRPWDLRPDINSVRILLSCLCGAPSLTRGQVCLLSDTVSNNCPLSSFIFFCFFFLSILHVTRFMYIQYMQGLVSPGSVQQIMPHHL
jgi:hypothetical protein